MSRRSKKSGTSFWVGYSDLMTSLFFIFLVIATTLIVGFRSKSEEFKSAESDLSALKIEVKRLKAENAVVRVKAEEFDRMHAVTKTAQKLTKNNRFIYNEQCNRFELRDNFTFQSKSAIIPVSAHSELIAAGKEIEQLVRSSMREGVIQFKILVEGRAAKFVGNDRRNADPVYRNKELSYRRALAVAKLWEQHNIDLNTKNCELFVSGSGFEGLCRYDATPEEEGKNKRIIIQVIPFLAPES